MGKPMSYCRADQKNKYEEYYNITFIWNVVSNSEVNGCIFQFIDSFSGIVSEHPGFYRFLSRLRMDILE